MHFRKAVAAAIVADILLVATTSVSHAATINSTNYTAPITFATSTGSFGPRTVKTEVRDVRVLNPDYETEFEKCREGNILLLNFCVLAIKVPRFVVGPKTFVIDSGVVTGSQKSTKRWDDDSGWIGLDLGVTSAAGKLETNGEIGLALDYMLTTGSVEPDLTYSVTAHVPDAQSVEAGAFFSLTSESNLASGTIKATSPTANLSVDAILDVEASVRGKACAGIYPADTCSERKLNLPDINVKAELFSIDQNSAKLISGFLPPKVKIELPVGNLKAELKDVNKQLYVTTNTGFSVPGPLPPSSIAIELGSVELTQPIISSTGDLSNGSLKTSGTSDFIEVTADIDGLLMLPGASGAFKVKMPALLPDVTGTIDIFDMDLNVSLDLAQKYELESELMVDLAFDRLVNVKGFGEVLSWTGAWDSMPDMAVSGLTTFSPTYWLDASMRSELDFILSYGYNASFLKGKFNVSGIGGSFGPYGSVSEDLASTSFGLIDRSFAVTSFNSFSGPTFTVDPFLAVPDPVGPISAVPLPASIFLLFGAFAGLGGMTRRGKATNTSS